MDSNRMIRLLDSLPACRLRLIELASEVIGDDGKPDAERIAFRNLEIQEAIAEARAYSKATGEAVKCLDKLARS